MLQTPEKADKACVKIIFNAPRTLVAEIDGFVSKDHFTGRSEILRTALREFLDRRRVKDEVVP